MRGKRRGSWGRLGKLSDHHVGALWRRERRNEGWVEKVLDNGAVLRKFQQSHWEIFEPIVIHQRNPVSPRNRFPYHPSVFSCLGAGLGKCGLPGQIQRWILYPSKRGP